MLDQDQTGVLVTLDVVIPRLSLSNGWEVLFIRRNKEPFKGMWALPGGHLNTVDSSLAAAAQREVQEETGLIVPISMFKQVYTFEDFDDPRGKYLCLLYVLSESINLSTATQAGDDVSDAQWYSVDNLRNLPGLAFNHIKLLHMALRHMFTSYYYEAVGLEELPVLCQCEIEKLPGQYCENTAYWRFRGNAICPKHIEARVTTR